MTVYNFNDCKFVNFSNIVYGQNQIGTTPSFWNLYSKIYVVVRNGALGFERLNCLEIYFRRLFGYPIPSKNAIWEYFQRHHMVLHADDCPSPKLFRTRTTKCLREFPQSVYFKSETCTLKLESRPLKFLDLPLAKNQDAVAALKSQVAKELEIEASVLENSEKIKQMQLTSYTQFHKSLRMLNKARAFLESTATLHVGSSLYTAPLKKLQYYTFEKGKITIKYNDKSILEPGESSPSNVVLKLNPTDPLYSTFSKMSDFIFLCWRLDTGITGALKKAVTKELCLSSKVRFLRTDLPQPASYKLKTDQTEDTELFSFDTFIRCFKNMDFKSPELATENGCLKMRYSLINLTLTSLMVVADPDASFLFYRIVARPTKGDSVINSFCPALEEGHDYDLTNTTVEVKKDIIEITVPEKTV